MSEQPLPTKERIRAALDVLENYVGTDGKIDATKMTQEITRLRQRVEELEAVLLDYEEGVKSKEWASIVKDAERWRTGVGLNWIDIATVQRIDAARP